MNETDIVIVEGRDQNSNDVSYQLKNINPAIGNTMIRTNVNNFNGLTSRSLLTIIRRHDENITNA